MNRGSEGLAMLNRGESEARTLDDEVLAAVLAAKRLSRGTELLTFGLHGGGACFAVLGSITRVSIDGGTGVVGFEDAGKGAGVVVREPGATVS